METESLNYIHWNPSIEIINLGFYTIRWYGVLWVIGLICGYFFVKYLFQSNKIPEEKFTPLYLYAFFGIIIGARLGHCLFYDYDYFFSNGKHFIEMFFPIRFLPQGGWTYTGFSGLASHGGVIGLFIAIYIYCKKEKMKFLFVLDSIAFAAPLTAMFIRLGNLMNSEIIGKPTNVPWAFIFEQVDKIPRHPAQLYEAIFYGIIFCLEFIIYKIYPKKAQIGSGFFFGFCLTSIFVFRFFIEFLKEVQVDFEQNMTFDMGQILSLPLIFIGIFYIWKSQKNIN